MPCFLYHLSYLYGGNYQLWYHRVWIFDNGFVFEFIWVYIPSNYLLGVGKIVAVSICFKMELTWTITWVPKDSLILRCLPKIKIWLVFGSCKSRKFLKLLLIVSIIDTVHSCMYPHDIDLHTLFLNVVYFAWMTTSWTYDVHFRPSVSYMLVLF